MADFRFHHRSIQPAKGVGYGPHGERINERLSLESAVEDAARHGNVCQTDPNLSLTLPPAQSKAKRTKNAIRNRGSGKKCTWDKRDGIGWTEGSGPCLGVRGQGPGVLGLFRAERLQRAHYGPQGALVHRWGRGDRDASVPPRGRGSGRPGVAQVGVGAHPNRCHREHGGSLELGARPAHR